MIKKLKKTDEKKFVKVIKKNVNGSVSVFVLSSILLVILVLSVINLGVSNKITAQSEKIKGIEEEYKEASTDERMKQEYINKAKGNKDSDLVDVGKTDGSWSEDKGVCVPNIPPNSDMHLVKYEEESQSWVDDESNLMYNYYPEPVYKADTKKSKWANARVTVDGVTSYFVWIPRFEYKENGKEQPITVNFIKRSQTVPTEGYTIHPVFTGNVDNGGWDNSKRVESGVNVDYSNPAQEIDGISGFWMSKFEAIKLSQSGDVDFWKCGMFPNTESWGNMQAGNAYVVAENYNKSLRSHMPKNSEWGAVAILSQSQYGRNGNEIRINDTVTTGRTIENENSRSYNDATGVNTSTTGNVYGIYDLSGGRNEYIAAYTTNNAHGNIYLKQAWSFANNSYSSTNYATRYSMKWTGFIQEQTGDCLDKIGWYGDDGALCGFNYPIPVRGGDRTMGSKAGIFSSRVTVGPALPDTGFRVCLKPDEQLFNE